eukprot:4591578-Pleurochrysis_carterae.AAC.1
MLANFVRALVLCGAAACKVQAGHIWRRAESLHQKLYVVPAQLWRLCEFFMHYPAVQSVKA